MCVHMLYIQLNHPADTNTKSPVLPKAPALTFLSERGRAASLLMALCHGKCKRASSYGGILEAPTMHPGPPAQP